MMKFYSLKKILSKNAQYNIIIGERSNGKTYASLKYALEQYLKTGKQFAYMRRWQEDVKGKRAKQLFASLESDGTIAKLTNGEFQTIEFWIGKFYLARIDGQLNKPVREEKPIGFAFSLTEMEHDKSISYPDITTIIFDEFITRKLYLPDEFVTFMNSLSTIIRHRNDVKIFMLANTVNKYSPYFKEMGLSKIQEMKQGTIDIYRYGKSDLKVAVEYCSESNKQLKPSDIYFAFDNPKLEMIKGGKWELDLYPHLPVKYKPKDIILTYFISFDDNLIQAEIIDNGKEVFTYVHRKTTPIKNIYDIVFSFENSGMLNHITNITRPFNKLTKTIWQFFKMEKVFYQDNELGEIVRNYIVQCGKLL